MIVATDRYSRAIDGQDHEHAWALDRALVSGRDDARWPPRAV